MQECEISRRVPLRCEAERDDVPNLRGPLQVHSGHLYTLERLQEW